MKYFPLLIILLFLSGCIGGGLYNNPTASSYSEKAVFAKSRDELVRFYGPPNRQMKMDNGEILFLYKRVNKITLRNEKKETLRCTVRFWLRDSRITHIDQRGDPDECQDFLENGMTEIETDLR